MQLISDQNQLAAVLVEARSAHSLALDTEFIRDRSYFPQFCLLQLATPDAEYCIDTLAPLDLTMVWDRLYDPAIVKIVHSARQDFEIFFNLHGRLPSPVFDTQIAAAFCGFADQVGYATLVHDLCGVTLDKQYTRTDWSKRPLSMAELRYAADDVHYLHALYRELRDTLVRQQRLDWVTEECLRLTDAANYRVDENTAWRRLPAAFNLDLSGRQALRALARWRECTAREVDRPRQWVVSDVELLALARAKPGSLAALRECPAGRSAKVRAHEETILSVIVDALAEGWASNLDVRHGDAAQKRRVDEILAWVKGRATAAGIAPHLIATRRDVERAVAGDKDLRLFTGWRREFVGDTIATMIG